MLRIDRRYFDLESVLFPYFFVFIFSLILLFEVILQTKNFDNFLDSTFFLLVADAMVPVHSLWMVHSNLNHWSSIITSSSKYDLFLRNLLRCSAIDAKKFATDKSHYSRK